MVNYFAVLSCKFSENNIFDENKKILKYFSNDLVFTAIKFLHQTFKFYVIFGTDQVQWSTESWN